MAEREFRIRIFFGNALRAFFSHHNIFPLSSLLMDRLPDSFGSGGGSSHGGSAAAAASASSSSAAAAAAAADDDADAAVDEGDGGSSGLRLRAAAGASSGGPTATLPKKAAEAADALAAAFRQPRKNAVAALFGDLQKRADEAESRAAARQTALLQAFAPAFEKMGVCINLDAIRELDKAGADAGSDDVAAAPAPASSSSSSAASAGADVLQQLAAAQAELATLRQQLAAAQGAAAPGVGETRELPAGDDADAAAAAAPPAARCRRTGGR